MRRSSGRNRYPALSMFVGSVFLVALFLAPAIYNGSPFFFPDSVGYSRAGNASLDAASWLVKGAARNGGAKAAPASASAPAPVVDRQGDGTATSRSVYYGIPVVLLYRLAGVWGVAVAQVILTVGVLLAGLRWFPNGHSPWRDVAAVAVAGTLGGLAVFTDTLMPDLFGGLLIFAVAIFAGFQKQMLRRERWAWLALMALAILVHKGNMALFAVLICLVAGIAVITRRFDARAFAALALVLVVGWAGHAMVNVAVAKITGRSPLPTPFLLARVVGDGTALPYLDTACAQKSYLLCRYRDRFPMSEAQFLWASAPGVGVVGHLNEAELRLLASEGNAIIAGAVRQNPVRQVIATVGNMARQNITIGVTRFENVTGLEPALDPDMAPALAAYRHSAVVEKRMPLGAISWLMKAAYGLALIGLVVIVVRRSEMLFGTSDRAIGLQLILAGVLINACICGAISSTADRYQGRVAWLVPMILLVLIWPCLSRRSRPPTATVGAGGEDSDA